MSAGEALGAILNELRQIEKREGPLDAETAKKRDALDTAVYALRIMSQWEDYLALGREDE